MMAAGLVVVAGCSSGEQVSAVAERIHSLGSAAGFAADSYCVQLFG
jgi:hypothetical protein